MRKIGAARIFTIMRFATALANATMFTTYAVYYVVGLGLNPLQLLLVGMILEVSVLLFEGITGVAADTYGRKLSVVTGMFILGAGFMLEGSAIWLEAGGSGLPAIAWLLLAQVISGIGYTFVSGADAAWMVDEIGEEQAGRVFLKGKRAGLFGTLLGIALSVGMSMLGNNLPYVVGGFIYLMLAVYLLWNMKETSFIKTERTKNEASHWLSLGNTWLDGARVVKGNPLLWLVLAVTVFSGAASEGYDRLSQPFLIVDIGFPAGLSMAGWFGLLAAASTLLSLIVLGSVEKRLDLSDERIALRGMIVLTAARIAAIVVLAFSPNFMLALFALLFYDIVRALSEPIYETWMNLNIESRSRATVLSMISQSDALGQTAGGPLVGWVGSRYSIRISLLVSSALLLPILAVFAKAIRQR